MEGSKKCAEYLLTKNVGRCMNEIKKRWISYGRFTGKITILDATKEEINDLTRITGIRFERDKIKLSVKDFENSLKESDFAPLDLKEVIDCYFGYTIITKNDLQKNKEDEINQFQSNLYKILKDNSTYEITFDWFKHLFSDKESGYRILVHLKKEKQERVYDIFKSIILGTEAVLENQTNVPIAVFASRISGNPHFLDKGSESANLFVSFLTYIYQIEQIKSAQDWYALMEKASLSKDEIAGSVAIYNVHLNRVDGFHKGSEACYAYEQPFMASYANIMDINAITTDENKVYVVENEMVFSYLVKEMKNKHIAIICTSGQLSSTAQKIISLLAESNNQIYYSGDCDPEGLMICDKLFQKYPKQLHVWRMQPSDYQNSISQETISENRLKQLDHLENVVLKQTALQMREVKKSGYQENILEYFLDDLKCNK